MFEGWVGSRGMAAVRLRLQGRVARFGRDEDGALILFSLLLFVLMVMMGGFAVDLMRYENTRTTLQNSLDRCVLNAAALSQRLDPEEVVRDCMDRAGLGDQLGDLAVDEGMNFRSVRAVGLADSKPFFMHMIGIDEFDAHAISGAEQRITDVEIALVLDVSGSMNGAKIANLRTAAAEFVDTVLASDPNGRISISIVPYNAQVNLGPVLRAQYQATHQHGVENVNCLELPGSLFGTPTVPRNVNIPMAAFADVTGGTYGIDGYLDWADTTAARMNANAPFCRRNTNNIVRLPSNDTVALQDQIMGLTAGGNTSITLGMKWGMALLDPQARPMYETLASEGHIPVSFADRPYDWSRENTMKIVILMTDGEHVAHRRLNDGAKTGQSPIWRSTGDGNYSIRFTTGRPPVAGTNQYWVPHLNAWQAAPFNSGAGSVQQDWSQVWANQRLSWVAWQLYARALGTDGGSRNTAYNNAINALSSIYASVNAMNASLQQTCTQARDRDVIVYGIAFEAPFNGQTQISQCASSPAHYFDAQGLEIQDAFRAIASNITQLKLTQ